MGSCDPGDANLHGGGVVVHVYDGAPALHGGALQAAGPRPLRVVLQLAPPACAQLLPNLLPMRARLAVGACLCRGVFANGYSGSMYCQWTSGTQKLTEPSLKSCDTSRDEPFAQLLPEMLQDSVLLRAAVLLAEARMEVSQLTGTGTHPAGAQRRRRRPCKRGAPGGGGTARGARRPRTAAW